MNRDEALRALGLEPTSSMDDIKSAYREMVQILHPDKFASNAKLQSRATEQFKYLQEAYDFLTKGKQPPSSSACGRSSDGVTAGDTRSARLAGIAQARVQLVEQKDLALDQRHQGLVMLVAGGLVAFGLRRIPAIAGIASAVAVWGVVQLFSSNNTVNTIDEHLKRLKKEQRRIEEELASE